MKPVFHTITNAVRETDDVVTLDLSLEQTDPVFEPGQFNMLYAFGVGEIAISISGDPSATDRYVHTIRSVGPVSQALTEIEPGQSVGVRGPFGSVWPLAKAAGKDVLVVAGGLGLAPLRPVIYQLQHRRSDFGRVGLLVGARAPEEIPFRTELDRWREEADLQVQVTVDRAGPNWTGNVGLVTAELKNVQFDPADTVAMICGPEIMIRMTAMQLQDMGVGLDNIFVSLERNMKCAIGLCGHCQLGPHFVCRDGPVFSMNQVATLMNVREI